MTDQLLTVPSAPPAPAEARREHGSALRSEGAPLTSLQSTPSAVDAGRLILHRAVSSETRGMEESQPGRGWSLCTGLAGGWKRHTRGDGPVARAVADEIAAMKGTKG